MHGGDPTGRRRSHLLGERDEVQALIHGDRGDATRDHVAGAERVVDHADDGGLHEGLHELALATGTADVARAVHLPLAVDLLFEESAARIGEAFDPVQGVAAAAHEEPGVFVAGLVLHADRHAPDGVDDRLEALEVDLHVVVDGDAERALDGADQDVGAELIGGVDALFVLAVSDFDPQVARNGHERNLTGRRLAMQHHHRVAAPTTDVGGVTDVGVVGVVRVGALARIGADEEVVLEGGVRFGQRGGERRVAVHRIQSRVQCAHDADGTGNRHDERSHDEHGECDEWRALASSCRRHDYER